MWSLAAWRPPAARATSPAGVRSNVAGSTTSGSVGPPRPMATMTGGRPASRSVRAIWAATAVLPVRLPVPITATDGFVATAGRGGGSRRKSAPWYGTPATSVRAARRNRRRASTTGSSERSTTRSGEKRPMASTRTPSASSPSMTSSGARPLSWAARFSRPPSIAAPTTTQPGMVWGRCSMAARTTGG